MKEIRVIVLFVLASSASSASVKTKNEILESLHEPGLTRKELDFFANISTVFVHERRNKQLRKRIKDTMKKISNINVF